MLLEHDLTEGNEDTGFHAAVIAVESALKRRNLQCVREILCWAFSESNQLRFSGMISKSRSHQQFGPEGQNKAQILSRQGNSSANSGRMSVAVET